MPEEMTPYERTMKRMAGEPVDCVPNQNILMGFAARYIGSTYDRLAQDYRVLVEGNLRACEAFHIDLVSAISDPLREAAAYGAHVTFPCDRVPQCIEPLLSSAKEWEKCTTAALAVLYADTRRCGLFAAWDAIFTIFPLRCF